MNENAIVEATSPFALSSWEDMDRMAKYVASSGMFGITNPAQAICLFAIAQGEGISALAVLKKYHIIEGKPSMRADAMLAEFLKAGGGVIYHVRTDSIVAATYFSDKKRISAESEKRALDRMEILLALEYDENLKAAQRKEMYFTLTKLNREGEQTIVRTYADADAKGFTKGKDGIKTNWKRSPRAMLAARCDTEGIRIIMPGLIAGIMETNEAIELGDFKEDRGESQESRDARSMKEILAGYEEEVATADPQRKKTLFKLMADLREKIYNEENPATEAPQQAAQAAQEASFELVEDEEQKPAKKEITDWREYRIKHVGGLYRDQLLSDISLEDIEVLCESMAKKASKAGGEIYKQEHEMLAKCFEDRSRK